MKMAAVGAVMFTDGPLSRRKELLEGDGKQKWRRAFQVRTLLADHALRVDMKNQLFEVLRTIVQLSFLCNDYLYHPLNTICNLCLSHIFH